MNTMDITIESGNTLNVVLEGSNRSFTVDFGHIPVAVTWDNIVGKPEGRVFGGVITPLSTVPSSPREDVYYMAFEQGNYTDFGDFYLGGGYMAFVYYSNNSWRNNIYANDKVGYFSVNTSSEEPLADEKVVEMQKTPCFAKDNDGNFYYKSGFNKRGTVFTSIPRMGEEDGVISIQNATFSVSNLTYTILWTGGTVFTYSTTGVQTVIQEAIQEAQVGAASFKGTTDLADGETVTTDHWSFPTLDDYKAGWYWVVATAGTYVGQVCEMGDTIFCISDKSSSYSASDFNVLQTNININTKADKVQNATNGNIAGLDSSGNLTDSGKKASDFPTIIIPSTDGNPTHMTSAEIAGLKVGDIIVNQTQTGDVNFYVTKVTGSTDGSRVYAVNVNEQRIVTITFVKTSGTWAYQDSTTLNIGNKADKVVSATNGHLAGLNSSGNLTDSGYAPSDFPKIVIPSVDGTIQNMMSDEIASLKIGDIVVHSGWMNYYVVKITGNNNGSEILLTYATNESIITVTLKKTSGTWAYNSFHTTALSSIAHKVSGGTTGNLAGLSSTGDLTDSGYKPADFISAPSTAGTSGQVLTSDGQGGQSWQTPTCAVSDVTVDGTSIVSSGTAVIVTMTTTELNTLWNSI